MFIDFILQRYNKNLNYFGYYYFFLYICNKLIENDYS